MAIATVNRPCYCTREEVMRALDIKAAAYTSQQVDRKLNNASDTIDALAQRCFYATTATHTWDWPNYQYAYPWRLWLDQLEMAAQPTLVVSGTYLPTPVVIPSTDYFMQPINEGPPYTSIELRRDQNSAFGNNTTPQNDIGITGQFGFWMNTVPAGTISAPITTTTQTTVQMSAGALAGPGVGDVMTVDSERMLITDCNYISTGISTTGSGGNSALANDNTLSVPDGTQFNAGEILLLDSEWMLLQAVFGNNLLVKRAWGGSVLSTHLNPPIWANRLLTVTRGALGTTATTHLTSAPAVINEVPGMVKELAIATATIGMVNEPAAYSVATTASWYGSNARQNTSQKEAAPGVGYQGMLMMFEQSIFTRKARSRVI
jgi:hypothetical protein